MKYYLFFLFLLCSLSGYSQQDTTLVFSRPGYEKDPIRSKWKRSVAKKDSLWVVTFTDKKGVIQETISFADEDLSIRKGQYQRFSNGLLQEEGTYNRGYKVGSWTRYNANQKVAEKFDYSWGKLNGPYRSFWENGQLKEETNYAFGKRAGDKSMFYRDGRPALKEFYEGGKKITGAYFDQEGNATKESAIKHIPSYQGGIQAFYQYLSRSIQYPAGAAKNRISGTVYLAFIIKANGEITDIKVIKSPDEELSREAIRVIESSNRWIPGQEMGEPVDMYLNMPIKFSLPVSYN